MEIPPPMLTKDTSHSLVLAAMARGILLQVGAVYKSCWYHLTSVTSTHSSISSTISYTSSSVRFFICTVTMLDMEPFTLVEEGQESSTRLFDKFQDLTAARSADHDIQYLTKLRSAFPELIVTSIVSYSCNLLAFANAGHAVALPDKETDSFASWRGWVAAFNDREIGRVGQTIFFAKYRYTWNAEEFIMFTVGGIQYVLKEPAKGENVMSTSSATDALITAVGTWQSSDRKLVWVYDGYWQASKALFNQVEKAHWDNVILDEDMKKEIKGISKRFFESQSSDCRSISMC